MNATRREQLDWLAFLYVAGELPPDELDDFERRLASEQLARDAVSRAVKLTQTIRAAEEIRPAAALPMRRLQHKRSLGLAICLSACVLAAVACHLLLRGGLSPWNPVSEGTPPTDAELAFVWCETRSETAEQPSDMGTLLPIDNSDDSPTLPENVSDLVVPNWMLSAVAIEADQESRETEDG
jgi:hypothetical protein